MVINQAQIDKLVSRVRLITGGTGISVNKGVNTLFFKEGFAEWQRVKQALHHYFKFVREDDHAIYFDDTKTDSKIALKKFVRGQGNLVKVYPEKYELGGMLNKEYSFLDLFAITQDSSFGIGGKLGTLYHKTKKGISKGYAETKRVGKELREKGVKEGSKSVAKDYAKRSFSATKKALKDSFEGYKEEFAKLKSKKAIERNKKAHELNKKIAIGVIDETKAKVNNDEYKIILTSAENIIEDKYQFGGILGKKYSFNDILNKTL